MIAQQPELSIDFGKFNRWEPTARFLVRLDSSALAELIRATDHAHRIEG